MFSAHTFQVGTPMCVVVDSAADVAAFANYKALPHKAAIPSNSPSNSVSQMAGAAATAAKPTAAAPAAPAAPAAFAASAAPAPAAGKVSNTGRDDVSDHSIFSKLLAGPAVCLASSARSRDCSAYAILTLCIQVVRLLHEHPHINPSSIKGSGPKGRLLKGDVLAVIAAGLSCFCPVFKRSLAIIITRADSRFSCSSYSSQS
jgi:2-oxoglutarate dehydrogenase E2 component (dihydrolipoamide succinyltransferase)